MYGADCVRRPTGDGSVQALDLLDESCEGFGVRGDLGVFLLPWTADHHLGLQVRNAFQEAWVEPVEVVGHRGKNQLGDKFGVADRDVQRDAGSQAVPEDICFRHAQLPQRGNRVVGHAIELKRAIHVGGSPVALHLQRDDLMVLGKLGNELAEGGTNR